MVLLPFYAGFDFGAGRPMRKSLFLCSATRIHSGYFSHGAADSRRDLEPRRSTASSSARAM